MEDLNINPKATAERLISFIQRTVKKTGFEKAVIGLSGGVDSTTVLALTVNALGPKNTYCLILPYGSGQRDPKKVIFNYAINLGIPAENISEINIEPLVRPYKQILTHPDNLRLGNIMARTRMVILFDFAKQNQVLVMGTENKSEYLLGYFTRFGDEASDIEPMRNLYKTQIFALAEYLKIPKEILNKAPTAGLWEGQTDEGEFGFTYAIADKILLLYCDRKMNVDEIKNEIKDEETVVRVIARLKQNSFKHRLPYIY